MIATALWTGLRLGELRRLRWEDVDFDRKVLIVRKSKTGRSRQVPLRAEAVKALKECAEAQTRRQRDNGEGHCFTDRRTGKPLDSRLQNFLAKFRKRPGCAKASWNIFRHTFGSLLAQAGVSIFKISRWMGHASVDTTTGHYATLADGFDDDIEES